MLGKGQTQEVYGLIKINGLMKFMGLLILRGKLKSEDSLDLMVEQRGKGGKEKRKAQRYTDAVPHCQ